MKKTRMNSFVAVLIVCILLVGVLIPIVQAFDTENIRGFEKGPSYIPVAATKKVSLVKHDENSYLDDYAYLAAIPTAVFNHDNTLISHPLLFYEDEYPVEKDKERSLNSYQGLDYFMEDWMSYSNGELDQKILINMDENDASKWDAKETITIKANNPYEIASKIALQDWSYTDDAVIAVIDQEFKRLNNEESGTISGKIVIDKAVKQEHFEVEQTNSLNPVSNDFTVPEGYMYVYARCWYPSVTVRVSLPLPGFEMSRQIVIPSGDKDLQLYCNYNGEWMQTAVTLGWNIGGMDKERTETYVYKSGPWRLGITDVPTHSSGIIERYGKFADILRNMIRGVTYQTDITMYPGIELEIPDKPTFGCRNAEFTLIWDDPSAKLGFSLIGPSGEEVLSSSDQDVSSQELNLSLIGECLPGETYSICVFTLDELSSPVDFKVEYSWKQKYPKQEADALTSATEGAVLASALNAPLLYASPSELAKVTENVLNKLGVENIYLVNLGDHLEKDTKDKIKNIVNIKKEYIEYEEIYNQIIELTGKNDIIFSTIDPWTKWYAIDKKPAEETEAGLFIGPAAYCAAHHGSPVLIVDNHPEFSSAVVWHTEFWSRHANGFSHPSVAAMYLTGKRVYRFLDELGFDKEGMESMITVADQFEIGATWDRTFAGKAKPGRIFGTPVDTAYWISHNVFYPALIFNNPALNTQGINLIQGSKSERRDLLAWGNFGLKIIKPSQVEMFEYLILFYYWIFLSMQTHMFLYQNL
jgi:hypothetical protein